jgi:hypothetical protein
MECTTQPRIHDRFRQVIEAIVPIYAYFNDIPWAYVEELPSEVSGPQIRRFIFDYTIAEPVEAGLFSMGEEYGFQLDIDVAYGALPKEHAPWLITQDAVDLRTVLEAQLAPTLTGLLSVRRVAFEPLSDESGHWYGRHVFVIHYMHDTSLTAIPNI